MLNLKRPTIRLYPNPTSGMCHIDLPKGIQSAQLTVVDMAKRVIFQRRLNEPQGELNLTGLDDGIYQVFIATNKEIVFQKKLAVVEA